MRVFFMGTPRISADVLRTIAAFHEVVGVFCQPDKPVGRKAELTPPETKVVAEELGIPVFQPRKMKDGTAAATVRDLNPDVILVTAYGRILQPDMLAVPKYGCLNLHVSLLPKYRGAAPIQHAIFNGEKETGVTVIYMSEGLDEGDIIDTVVFPITQEDDAFSIFKKSAEYGGKLILKVLDDIENGVSKRIPQNHEGASFAPPLEKDMAHFNFSEEAESILNRVRALCMWPVAEFVCEGKRIKVLKTSLSELSGKPGEILSTKPLTVACGKGSIVLNSVKPENSHEMTGRDWAVGRRYKTGDIITESVKTDV